MNFILPIKAEVPMGTTIEQLNFDRDTNKPKDYGLVKKIRDELLKDPAISRTGKNIQIIVVGKEITLKGLVESQNEQKKILNLARGVSTGHIIRDQLEIPK